MRHLLKKLLILQSFFLQIQFQVGDKVWALYKQNKIMYPAYIRAYEDNCKYTIETWTSSFPEIIESRWADAFEM